MAIPAKFYQPWSEIDPSGNHGGLPGNLDEFVAPRLGDNPSTQNRDLHYIFADVRDCAAALSMHPQGTVEGPPIRNTVEEVLKALNLCLERIVDRTKSTSTNFFLWQHAVPPAEDFRQRPIRYPLRNKFLDSCIYFFLGALVEIAEANANGLHAGLDTQSGALLLSPFLHLKATCAKDLFDREVEGEISPNELAGLFGSLPPAPTITTPDETQPAPPAEAVSGVLSGIELLQWYPDDAEWTIFAHKNANAFRAERIWQPESASPTTEDVAPPQPVPSVGPTVSRTGG